MAPILSARAWQAFSFAMPATLRGIQLPFGWMKAALSSKAVTGDISGLLLR
jgi:hypothetical protein